MYVLAELGWIPPTHFAEDDADHSEGSPNHWLDLPDDTPARQLAELMATTLRTIHHVGEPEDLTYESSNTDGNRIILGAMQLSRTAHQ